MYRLLPLLFLLAGCTTSMQAHLDTPTRAAPMDHTTLTIRYDPGGDVRERLQTIDTLTQNQQRVAILGTCASACTLFLGMPTTCVAPTARLGFHGPSTRKNGRMVPLEDTSLRIAVTVMTETYPPYIRPWFTQHGAVVFGDDVVWLSGAAVIKAGATPC